MAQMVAYLSMGVKGTGDQIEEIMK